MADKIEKGKVNTEVVALGSECKCSYDRVGGWLAAFQVAFALAGIGALWTFFYGWVCLAQGTTGTSVVLSIEAVFAGLILAGGFLTAAVLIGLRKKLSLIWTYIALGASLLFTTIMAITVMTFTYTTNTYNDHYYSQPSSETNGLPAGVIILLVGVIIVTLVKNALIAFYFFKSERVQKTLTK